jgi:hypothetical protein
MKYTKYFLENTPSRLKNLLNKRSNLMMELRQDLPVSVRRQWGMIILFGNSVQIINGIIKRKPLKWSLTFLLKGIDVLKRMR